MVRIGHLGDSFGTDSTEVEDGRDGLEDGGEIIFSEECMESGVEMECSSVQSDNKMEIGRGREGGIARYGMEGTPGVSDRALLWYLSDY